MVMVISTSSTSKTLPMRATRRTHKYRRVVSRRPNILSRQKTIAAPTDVKPRSVRFSVQPVSCIIKPRHQVATESTWLGEDDMHRIQAENQCTVAIARACFTKTGMKFIENEHMCLLGLEHYVFPGRAESDVQQHIRRTLESVGHLF